MLLDVSEQTSLAEYFIIATVNNERQSVAIEHDILRQLRMENQVRPMGMEGIDKQRGSGWVLLDYGDVIIHLLTEEMREYYDLESLWDKAQVVLKMI